MAKTDTNTEEHTTKISKWFVTDHDGTVVLFHSDPNITIPPAAFIEKMRTYSFAHPDTAIMVLSGRKDEDLTRFYEEAFKPNEEGKIPNIILASENGAFLRFSTDPENLHKQAEPLSNELKENIVNTVKAAAGDYFTENFPKEIGDEIAVRVEMKTFGLSIHYRIPNEKTEEGKIVLGKLKETVAGIVNKNPELHPDFNAANAFTVELVSKGGTMKKLADHDPTLVDVFDSSGLVTGKPNFISYSGDDRGDWPALNTLNERLNNDNTLEGYTSRPCNHSPSTPDVETRTPNGPKETGAGDAFYVLGSKETAAQEQHQNEFLNDEAIKHKNAIREELSKRGLLPSQSGDDQTPPIVLLTTGDILIQEPAERYKSEVLDKLKDWNFGKVVLMAKGANSDSLRIKKLGLEYDNLIAVDAMGRIFNHNQHHDSQSLLLTSMKSNEIDSANPERSGEIQFLRVVQEVLLANGLIKKNEQSQEAVPEIDAQVPNEVPCQEKALSKSESLLSLAFSSESKGTQSRRRRKRSSNKGKIEENKRRGSWTNNKKEGKKKKRKTQKL